MNRTDGLVRRNISRATENGTAEANSSTANSVDENDVIINDREEDIDDTDSKETRLTLMEEVLLLGLKDKEVNICDRDRPKIIRLFHELALHCMHHVFTSFWSIHPMKYHKWYEISYFKQNFEKKRNRNET